MKLQIVAWPEDRVCERSWLLDNVAGVAGAIVMPTEKVGFVLIPLTENRNVYFRLTKSCLKEVNFGLVLRLL